MEVAIYFNNTNVKDLSNKSAGETFNKEYIFGSINGSIYLLCSIFSIILNLPLIINWILNCKKDNYADVLIISIVFVDFLDGFLVCPIYFIQELIKMNLISPDVISPNIDFVTKSIDLSIWFMMLSSLLRLSLHRFKQLISPFKEEVKLNKFRILTIVSIWFIFPIISFLSNWLIKNEELIELLFCVSVLIVFISVCILNILIILEFKSKLKNTKLNKSNFKNEKKAILCTLSFCMLLFIIWVPYLILEPFKFFKYEFVEYLHDICYSFAYSYMIVDPVIVLFFNKRLRIDLRLFFSKLEIRSQTYHP